MNRTGERPEGKIPAGAPAGTLATVMSQHACPESPPDAIRHMETGCIAHPASQSDTISAVQSAATGLETAGSPSSRHHSTANAPPIASMAPTMAASTVFNNLRGATGLTGVNA